MKSRLCFSISVNVDPEIMIIDEALSVGDKAFAEKSLAKMNEFKDQGKTMIFVSHSIGQMKRFCSKILWLEFGQVKQYGTMPSVMSNYENFLAKWRKMTDDERAAYKHASINAKGDLLEVNVNDYFKPDSNYNKVIEKPVSKMARLKETISYIYDYPNKDKNISTENLKDTVFYVKKEARYQDKTYYLLSKERSSIDGVIGRSEERRVGKECEDGRRMQGRRKRKVAEENKDKY